MGLWRVLLWCGVVLVGAWFLYLVRGILPPFLLAIIISVLLDPTIQKLRLRGWPRWAAVLSVFFGFFVIATVLFLMVAPTVNDQIWKLRTRFDAISAQLSGQTEFDSILASRARTLERAGLPTVGDAWRSMLRDGVFGGAIGVESLADLDQRIREHSATLRASGLPNDVPAWREFLEEKDVSPMEGGRDQATARIDQFLESNEGLLKSVGLPTTRSEWVEQYFEPYKDQMAEGLQKFLAGFLGVISGVVGSAVLLTFTPLITLFILLDLEDLKRRGASWIPPSIRTSTIDLIRDVSGVFVKYLRGMTMIVIVYSTVTAFLLTLLGAPYAVIMGVVISLLGLIPTIGSFISFVVNFVVVGLSGKTGNWMFDAGSPWAFALVVTLVLVVVLTAMDQVLYPKLVGTAVGLSPAVSMFVLFSAGALFGLVGAVIAFPLAGAVKVILERVIRVTTAGEATLGLPRVPLRHRDI